MASTYEPIATTTVAVAATSITFSSIPSTYTDLRIVFVGTGSTSLTNLLARYNGSSAAAYSATYLYGDGTTAGSANSGGANSFQNFTNYNSLSMTIPTMRIIDFFSYAGSTYKTCLWSETSNFNGSGSTVCNVGLWSNTAAITSITLLTNAVATYSIGTTATLYGIKAA